MQPDFASRDQIQTAQEGAAKKSNSPTMQKLRYESFKEGKAVQVLYLGAYADEGPTILRLHDFLCRAGVQIERKAS